MCVKVAWKFRPATFGTYRKERRQHTTLNTFIWRKSRPRDEEGERIVEYVVFMEVKGEE
jgi:hypothetical protein